MAAILIITSSKTVFSQSTHSNGHKIIMTQNREQSGSDGAHGYNTNSYGTFNNSEHNSYYEIAGDDSNMYYNPNSGQTEQQNNEYNHSKTEHKNFREHRTAQKHR